MPSGYEQSPDYSGPPTWRSELLFTIVLVAIWWCGPPDLCNSVARSRNSPKLIGADPN
jgi:hypothetical protein